MTKAKDRSTCALPKCANPKCTNTVKRRGAKMCSKACMAAMQVVEHKASHYYKRPGNEQPRKRKVKNVECANCKKPLSLQQKMYCSRTCRITAEASRMTKLKHKVWDLKKNNPTMTIKAMADALGMHAPTVSSIIYSPDSPWAGTGVKRRRRVESPQIEAERFQPLEAPSRPQEPAPALHPELARVHCQWNAGSVWEQCPNRSMPGENYCVKHYRQTKGIKAC